MAKQKGGFLIRYLDPVAFLVALALGIMLVFLLAPKRQIVYRFPSPSTTDTVYEEGESGKCYRFQATKVDCGVFSEDLLRSQPGTEPAPVANAL